MEFTVIMPPREKAPTLHSYLNKINKQTIRSDAEVQRLSGQWDKGMEASLIETVLTNDYIPAIVLAEIPVGNEGCYDTYILDGLQRSTTLRNFRHGNSKITKDIDIPYQVVVMDEDGNRSNEWRVFNLKNKHFSDLPEELKEIFDEYQIRTMTHENCSRERANHIIRKMNQGKGMTVAQKAFTHQGDVAGDIRKVINESHFFEDCGNYSSKVIANGQVEKIVTESYLTIFERDKWACNAIEAGIRVNELGTKENFNTLKELFVELYPVCDGGHADFFNTKNTSVFVAAYYEFRKFGLPTSEFGRFLNNLEGDLANKELNGETWNDVDIKRNTKDKKTVLHKIEFLEALMKDFFGIDAVEKKIEDETEKINSGDIDFANACLDDVLDNTIRIGHPLRNSANRNAMVKMLAYLYKEDIDSDLIDDWFTDYAERVTSYSNNTEESFNKMKEDFCNYSRKAGKVA